MDFRPSAEWGSSLKIGTCSRTCALPGGGRAEIEKETGQSWNAVVAPKPAGLRVAAAITRENLRRRVKTYLNVNNHYEGSAPLTIGRFLETLGTAAPAFAEDA